MAPTPIAFGTSGWRGILSDDFTFFNLRRATRAVARYVREEKKGHAPRLFVGYDTRFLSEHLAREAASVLVAEGVKPRLAADFVPTPVVAHAIRRGRLDGGINLTAGHNPGEYHGLKFSTRDGAPAPPEVMKRIEALAREIPDGSPPPAPRPSEIRTVDPGGPYRTSILGLIDRRAISKGPAPPGLRSRPRRRARISSGSSLPGRPRHHDPVGARRPFRRPRPRLPRGAS